MADAIPIPPGLDVCTSLTDYTTFIDIINQNLKLITQVVEDTQSITVELPGVPPIVIPGGSITIPGMQGFNVGYTAKAPWLEFGWVGGRFPFTNPGGTRKAEGKIGGIPEITVPGQTVTVPGVDPFLVTMDILLKNIEILIEKVDVLQSVPIIDLIPQVSPCTPIVVPSSPLGVTPASGPTGPGPMPGGPGPGNTGGGGLGGSTPGGVGGLGGGPFGSGSGGAGNPASTTGNPVNAITVLFQTILTLLGGGFVDPCDNSNPEVTYPDFTVRQSNTANPHCPQDLSDTSAWHYGTGVSIPECTVGVPIFSLGSPGLGGVAQIDSTLPELLTFNIVIPPSSEPSANRLFPMVLATGPLISTTNLNFAVFLFLEWCQNKIDYSLIATPGEPGTDPDDQWRPSLRGVAITSGGNLAGLYEFSPDHDQKRSNFVLGDGPGPIYTKPTFIRVFFQLTFGQTGTDYRACQADPVSPACNAENLRAPYGSTYTGSIARPHFFPTT